MGVNSRMIVLLCVSYLSVLASVGKDGRRSLPAVLALGSGRETGGVAMAGWCGGFTWCDFWLCTCRLSRARSSVAQRRRDGAGWLVWWLHLV
jgi:hypothetical protein